MALRRALARGLEQWGRPAGHQAAGLWTETAGRALEPAKVRQWAAERAAVPHPTARCAVLLELHPTHLSLFLQVHLGHSSQAIAAAAAWQPGGGLRWLLRSPSLPAAAAAAAGGASGAARAAGRRAYSSSSSGGGGGSTRETLQGAAQRFKAAAASSADAVKAVGGAVSKAPGAVYKVLPTSAKQLVNAAQVRRELLVCQTGMVGGQSVSLALCSSCMCCGHCSLLHTAAPNPPPPTPPTPLRRPLAL